MAVYVECHGLHGLAGAHGDDGHRKNWARPYFANWHDWADVHTDHGRFLVERNFQHVGFDGNGFGFGRRFLGYPRAKATE